MVERSCRFKSCHPHQKMRTNGFAFLLCGVDRQNLHEYGLRHTAHCTLAQICLDIAKYKNGVIGCACRRQGFNENHCLDSRSFSKTAIISSCTVFGDFRRIRGLFTAITRPYSLNRK